MGKQHRNQEYLFFFFNMNLLFIKMKIELQIFLSWRKYPLDVYTKLNYVKLS